MLAGLARGEYKHVDEGARAANSVDLELTQRSHGEKQPVRIRWLFLWAGSLCGAFVVGFYVAPRAPVAARSPPSLNGIMNLAEPPSHPATLYHVYDKDLKTAHYIDLTHAFSPKTAVWPGFGKATFRASRAGADMGDFVSKGDEFTLLKHGFIATSYELTTDQYGTQLDPPAHWNEYGATISDLPPTFALRPLVVINIAPKVRKNPKYAACVSDVEDWEKLHGRVPEGSAVFFRSDWSKKWPEYMKMAEPPSTYPGVELKTLQFLHLDRKILFHGHEPLDTDMTATLEGEAWLMHNNFAQAEGVANLDQVPESGCLLSIGYAKPLGGVGGYARYVAVCPSSITSAGTTIEESPGAPLPKQPYPLRRNADGVLAPDKNAKDTKYCSVAGALGCAAVGKPVWK